MTLLPLGRIRTDGNTQARAQLDLRTVEEYAEAMAGGAMFPLVTVFHDGADYWLADGFHRLEAATRAGLAEIAADVRAGGNRDAVLWACGANATHGLRRTNADKRAAVVRMLEDPEWRQWTDREIARRTGTTHPFVGKVRAEVVTITTPAETLQPLTAGEAQRQAACEAVIAKGLPGALQTLEALEALERGEAHPYTNIVPDMTPSEFAQLKASIAGNGQRLPILLDTDGRIIDGRQRYRACMELGIRPVYEVWDGANGSVLDVIISRNLLRQSISESQRAVMAVDLEQYLAAGGQP